MLTANDHVLTANDHVLTANGHVLKVNDHVLTVNGHGLTANGHVLTANGHVLTANGRLLTANGHVLTANGHVLTANGHVMTVNGHVLTANGLSFQVDDGGLISIAQHCHALTQLDFSQAYDHSVTDVGMGAILIGCANLERLVLKGMKGVRRFVSIIPGMLLFCFKGSEEICLYYSRGGSGTKCRTSRRLSVVLDIFH